ncbi:MAG: hypothetical protein IAG13_11610 [Deltaproteobacteria bacterium]|nr:hypothetical protein [Nannocystaceae bacterium]
MAGCSLLRGCAGALTLTACALTPGDEGVGGDSSSSSSSTTGSDDGHTGVASVSSTSTTLSTSGSLEDSSTAADTTTEVAETSSEASSSDGSTSEGSTDSGSTTAPPSCEPIVLGIGSTGTSGDEVSAFAELESFVGEYDEDVCNAPPPCDGNTAPQIDAPIFWVNGAQLDDPSEIVAGDRVGVLFPFADAECNVGCGATSSAYETPGDQAGGGGSAYSDFPCDTASTQVYLGFDFYEVEDPGEYDLSQVRLTDICGDQGSNNASFDVP